MHRVGDKAMSAQLFDPVSPLKHAARIQAPVLVMHGKDDTRVPISHSTHSKNIRDALEQERKPVTWLVFDEEKHGLRYVRNRILYYETLLALLGKHIPAKTAANASTHLSAAVSAATP